MSYCVWLTGLPCSGKTTIATALQEHLRLDYGQRCAILDGDVVRAAVWPELGFSPEDRLKNVTRTAYLAKKILESGGNVIVALVSPYYEDRAKCYDIIGKENVIEVYVDCDPEICEKRDVKGMWAKARIGEIQQFTGVSDLYEPPIWATVDTDLRQISVRTHIESVEECVRRISLSLVNTAELPLHNVQLFIGRWSPFHNGHKHIVDEARKKGPVAIGVRATFTTSNDPWPVDLRIKMIKAVYPDVYVFAVPDISSIHIGRTVGYEVVRYDVPEEVAGVSASDIRWKMICRDSSWREMVPDGILGTVISHLPSRPAS